MANIHILTLLLSVAASTEWIEIATETVNNAGTDKWRFLDFANEIYGQYNFDSIDAYKLEWGTNYEKEIVFDLGTGYTDHRIFENTANSVNPNIKINILESNVAGLPVADDQYFCKACADGHGTKPGDTCWAILDKSDANRVCGCNSPGWAGNGAYYGGYLNGECQCLCWGGAFAGYRSNGEQKGTIPSKGLRLSILTGNAPRAHYKHIMTMNNKCMQVNDYGYVQQYTCVPDQTNQLFHWNPSTKQIRDYAGRCMDFDADALVWAGGQPVKMKPCDPLRATFQTFSLDVYFDGYIKTDQLSTSHFGHAPMCLNLGGGSDADGTVIQAWICYIPHLATNEVFRFETINSAKAGLFDLDEGIATNTATGYISPQMVIYGMYSLIGLLLINIICFIMYCFKNKQNNTYKVISMETDTD